MITFNFNDLKTVTDKMPGKKGVWYVGVKIHDGHRYLVEQLRKKVDHVIGVYYVNFYRHLEYVFGKTISTMEHAFNKFWNIDEDTLNEIGRLSDFVYISTGDHNPLKSINKNLIYEQFPDEMLPEYIRNDRHYNGLLRVGQAIMKLMDENRIYDYQLGCIKDCWKPYQKIWSDKYTNIEYETIEPLNDQYGNNISNSSKEMLEKIDRKIILPEMKTIEDANENIKDIEGLKVTAFHIDKTLNRIYARIQYKDVFCNLSVRLK